MKTLVTGGGGFIGGHLVEQLLNDGHDVISMDIFPNGIPNNSFTKKHKNLKFVEDDVANEQSIFPHFSGIDWVFHLACLGGQMPSIERPTDYYRTNVNGTLWVLEACKKANVKRIIYCASTTCYGEPDKLPTPEDSEIKLEYPLSVTKYLGEVLALSWNTIYQVPVNSVRFTTVYGNQSSFSKSFGSVLTPFLNKKLSNEPYTVVGDGSQTRDFTFVSDAVDACLAVVKSNVVGEAFNVGSGDHKSINDLISFLGGGDVTYLPDNPGEAKHTLHDITKIKTLIGWDPKISLQDGVKIILNTIK